MRNFLRNLSIQKNVFFDNEFVIKSIDLLDQTVFLTLYEARLDHPNAEIKDPFSVMWNVALNFLQTLFESAANFDSDSFPSWWTHKCTLAVPLAS